MGEVVLRAATVADVPLLRRWDEQPHVIDSDPDDDWQWETELAKVQPGLRAIDLWIGEADCLGRGYGTQMMRLALARCFAAPDVTAVLIDPLVTNTGAHRFYERIGFRFLERRQFGSSDCLVYRLDRADCMHGDSRK